MDVDSNPSVDARRRRALLVAILAFPIIAGMATWGAAGLDILPGGVQLEAPTPTVVPASPPGPDIPGGLIVQPPVDPRSLLGTVPTAEAPCPPAAVPPRCPAQLAGDAGPAAGGTSYPGRAGSGAPDPGTARSVPPSPGGTIDEPPAIAGSDDNERDNNSNDNRPTLSDTLDALDDNERTSSGRDDERGDSRPNLSDERGDSSPNLSRPNLSDERGDSSPNLSRPNLNDERGDNRRDDNG